MAGSVTVSAWSPRLPVAVVACSSETNPVGCSVCSGPLREPVETGGRGLLGCVVALHMIIIIMGTERALPTDLKITG